MAVVLAKLAKLTHISAGNMETEIMEPKMRYVVKNSSGPKKFSPTDLVANSSVAAVGAGLAAGAATGLIWPALAAAAVGAIVGYTATNEIPKNGD